MPWVEAPVRILTEPELARVLAYIVEMTGQPVEVLAYDGHRLFLRRQDGVTGTFVEDWLERTLRSLADHDPVEVAVMLKENYRAGRGMPDAPARAVGPLPRRRPHSRHAVTREPAVKRDPDEIAARLWERRVQAELDEQRAARCPEDHFVDGIGWLTTREAAAYFHDEVTLDMVDIDGRLKRNEPTFTARADRPHCVVPTGYWGPHRARRNRLPLDDCRSATE